MKKLALLAFLVLVSFSSLNASDGIFLSYVIHETDSPINFTLSSRQFIKINSFTQTTVGVSTNGATQTGAVTVFQGAAGLPGAVAALAASGFETQTTGTVIAGPMVVNINPVGGSTLFITFLMGENH